MRHSWRCLFLLCITVLLFAGCAPTFNGAIINGTAMQIDAIEYANPSGKRLLFHDVEPYHVKSFASTWPDGAVHLFWKEGPEGGNKTYGVAFPAERLRQAANGFDSVLLFRIQHEQGHEPQVLMAGVPGKDYSNSLLQPRGDAYPAHLIEH